MSDIQCIGLILDGNRRWAKERGLPSLQGHKQGLETLVQAVRWIRDRGIKHAVAYVFSTENWNRSEEEVSYLMRLLQDAATHELQALSKDGVRIRCIGDRTRLSESVRSAVERIESESAANTAITLWLCLSYGGRAEIAAAAHAAAAHGGSITEASLHAAFWSAEMPDPDIIIRTGGERRLSNFLLWQAAYSEFFFVDAYWPDFSEKTLDGILAEYATRERRHGK